MHTEPCVADLNLQDTKDLATRVHAVQLQIWATLRSRQECKQNGSPGWVMRLPWIPPRAGSLSSLVAGLPEKSSVTGLLHQPVAMALEVDWA